MEVPQSPKKFHKNLKRFHKNEFDSDDSSDPNNKGEKPETDVIVDADAAVVVEIAIDVEKVYRESKKPLEISQTTGLVISSLTKHKVLRWREDPVADEAN